MDAAFWHARWQEGRTGFHQDEVTPLLERHWAACGVSAGGRVFVPLAGKSRDMLWLAAQGHRVLGIELSPLAVGQFFKENALRPVVTESEYGRHHAAGPIELVCGDAFALDAQALADCDGVFDRAALIALPPTLRERYARELYARLPRGCRGLLVTLEYPQHEKAGPPFSVDEDEVRERFGGGWRIDALERRDILPGQPAFADEGVTRLQTVAYRLARKA